jgi:glucose-1-phosphate adenylyltransferase
MVNAQINEIGVICKENYGSLFDHIGNGKDWDLNRRKGGVKMLTPMARAASNFGISRGRLDALRAIKDYIADSYSEWVVFAFGGTVANVDLEAMLAQHIADGAYLTLAYADTLAGAGEMLVEVDNAHNLTGYKYQKETAKGNYALGTAIMKKADLLTFLEEAEDNDYSHLNKELIQKNIGVKKICGYYHKGYAHIIDTVDEYYEANMEMLIPENKASLFAADRPVYTKVKDSVPVLYDFGAAASNCLISDGCLIKGIVKNSILGRNVTVEEGAIVENSILMQNTVVGAGAKLDRIIADKNVTIQGGAELKGAPTLPIVIGKGKQI